MLLTMYSSTIKQTGIKFYIDYDIEHAPNKAPR